MADQHEEVLARIGAAVDTAVTQVKEALSPDHLEQLRIQFLGRKGEITQLARAIGEVTAEYRPRVGQAVNQAKQTVEGLFDEIKEKFLASIEADGPAEAIDITLPGIRTRPGKLHPITETMERMKSIMIGLGFSFDDYPEVETEYFNFDGLNIPTWHPARDMHDTLFVDGGRVLRTHTSSFQQHAMKIHGEPPIRAITAGHCYRRDAIDASHFPAFHQMDAISIDKGVSFADLKWTLGELFKGLFGSDARTRFRPSFFPFTTPSAEVDVSCPRCGGSGCTLCKHSGWLELLGSGMMHPNVLSMAGLDPDVYSGWAFGMGIDRVTMIRYGIDDIRYLVTNQPVAGG
jgi:phenylalanyl-tRNA synthetase alpha chain